jgi:hypothetical protein
VIGRLFVTVRLSPHYLGQLAVEVEGLLGHRAGVVVVLNGPLDGEAELGPGVGRRANDEVLMTNDEWPGGRRWTGWRGAVFALAVKVDFLLQKPCVLRS